MLDKLQEIANKQKVLIKSLKTETFEDIHSILRSDYIIKIYLELEIKRELLIELISNEK
jgi:hypothetical protein